MNADRPVGERLQWAGPALFTAVAIGIVVFFWWFLL